MARRLFTWRLFPSTWISVLLLVLLFPLGYFLPEWWGWENGPLENIQVALLIAGAALSWLVARRNSVDSRLRKMWLWTIPIWLLLIGRELSWGRVFFAPVSVGTHGPIFPAKQAIWYGAYVNPIIAVIAISALSGLWYNFRWSEIKRVLRIPLIDLILLFVLLIAGQFVFEKTLLWRSNLVFRCSKNWLR